MRICLVTPAPPGSRTGNGVTARRWARILRDLGHTVIVEQAYQRGSGDVLVALHARRSALSIEHFRHRHPDAPIVLALTGTDLYGGDLQGADIEGRDGGDGQLARRSLRLATHYVVLQPRALDELPLSLRDRCHVIYQSAVAPPGVHRLRPGVFQAAVLAHMRPVKDPLLAAEAARLLPVESTVRVVHAGGALDDEIRRQAQAVEASNPRYRWVGDLPRWRALRMLARSRVLLVTSRTEGGANVISEALACSVPVLSSHVPGSIGILGADYPGYFEVGDAAELAGLLRRAEVSPPFYEELADRCRGLKALVEPAAERDGWRALIQSL